MLLLCFALAALPAAPQVDGGLSAVTAQELVAANAPTTNPCYSTGARDPRP